MKLSWIHISDLHVRSSSDYQRDTVSSKLISAVAHEEPAEHPNEQTSAEHLDEAVEVLALVVHDRDEAARLADRVGFPPARMPAFNTSRVFWDRVVKAIHNGAVDGGIKSLIDKAAEDYPYNLRFSRLRTSLNARARAVQRRTPSSIQPGAIDAIFVTGDLVSRGSFDAYEQVSRFLDDLGKAAGLRRERVFVVPGNHDVDRKHMGLARTPGSAEESDRYFDSGHRKDLFERLAAFADWYDRYFKGIREYPRHTTCGPIEVIDVKGGKKVGVLPINTALFSTDDRDRQNLWIGRRCLDRGLDDLSRRAPDVTFALMHHPLEYLHVDERSYIRDRLERSVDVVLRGHLHEDRTSDIVGLRGRTLHVAAGAAHQATHHPRLAFLGRIEDRAVFVEPLRYDDDNLAWHHDQRMFGDAEGRFELPRRRTDALQRRSHGDDEDRETQVELSAAELSNRTVAWARGEGRVIEALAALCGLSYDAVRHRLGRAGSRVRLRTLFDLSAERSRDEAGLTSLGSRTTASVRANPAMIATIAAALDLSEKKVSSRLERFDGRFRVRTVFADEWPGDDEDEANEDDEGVTHTTDELAEWRVAAARDDEAVLDSLAAITGLTLRKVKRRLTAADPRTYLRNAFVNEWPAAPEGDAVEAGQVDLGSRTVRSVRDDEQAIAAIAERTGLGKRSVSKLLEQSDGRYRVRTIFARQWSDDDDDGGPDAVSYSAEDLAERTVAAVRDDDDAIDALVALTGLTVRRVRRGLKGVNGRTLLRNLFADEWPLDEDDEHEADGEAAAHNADELADFRVAAARDDEAVLDSLATITGLTLRKVKRRLTAADPRTYLRNAFVNEWPAAPEGDAVEAGQVDLGSRTVRSVRDDEQAIAAIAERTGLGKRSVSKLLEQSDGRYRVRTIFARQWSDDDDDGGPDAVSYSAEDLAERTVAAVRDDDDAIDALVALTGLTVRRVRRRFQGVNGRTLLRNLFDDHWPEHDEASAGGSEDEGTYSAAALAEWTAAAARDDEEALDALSMITGMTRGWVRRGLIRAEGRTLVRNVLAHRWPESEVSANGSEELGARTVASVRAAPTAIAEICAVTGFSERLVTRRVEEFDGRYRVRTLFRDRWPREDSDDEGRFYSAHELADRTVASVRNDADDDVFDSLVSLTGLAPRWVRRYLNGAEGQTLIRNALAAHWPSNEV